MFDLNRPTLDKIGMQHLFRAQEPLTNFLVDCANTVA